MLESLPTRDPVLLAFIATLGTYLLMAYLPPEHAVEGTKLGVVYMNEQYPVTVARVGSQPLFDPTDDRMKTDPS